MTDHLDEVTTQQTVSVLADEEAVLGTVERDSDTYVSLAAGSPQALVELLKYLGWRPPVEADLDDLRARLTTKEQ